MIVFKPTKFAKTIPIETQLLKIQEENGELIKAYMKSEPIERVIEEAVDLGIALTTFLKIMDPTFKLVEEIYQQVEMKNRERNYYE